MIVDCHTHIWSDVSQLGKGADNYLARQLQPSASASEPPEAALPVRIRARPGDHAQAAECVDKTLVLGFQSVCLDAKVPNDFIAEYVAEHPDRMIGIAAVDPTEPVAVKLARQLLGQDEFRGLTVSPALQDFHPADSRAMALYELASELGAPIIFQQSTHFPATGHMEYARCMLLDEIAREFPDLTIVVSSLGHPWVAECVALMGKHRRVFADISGLVRRPWQAYNALVLAHQFNVMDKVLFSSDFPFYDASRAIQSLYRLHEVTQGTNLPIVPREALRSVIERNALEALGIALPNELMQQVAVEDEI